MLKAPYSTHFYRRNEKRPFGDLSSLTFLCEKNHCSLFAFASNFQKRPLFDFQLLGRFQLGVDAAVVPVDRVVRLCSEHIVGARQRQVVAVPGRGLRQSPNAEAAQGFWVDYFGGQIICKYNVITLNRVLVLTALSVAEGELTAAQRKAKDLEDVDTMVLHYRVEYRAWSRQSLPFVHLE